MVSSHAKHNSTQFSLTHHERSLLRKENQARRLGADSMKPLDSCNLCLTTVTIPVACSSGHLYCRECAITNLITQKAGIEAQKVEMERWEANDLREREEARMRARERVVKDFEKGMGLGMGVGIGIGLNGSRDIKGKEDKVNANRPTMEQLTQEAEERALKTLEMEQIESRKHKLAAFWLPDLAPEARLGPLKDVKLQTLCHVGDQPHPFSRKSLLPVILSYPSSSSNPKKRTPICPSCSRELSNAVPSVLLSSRSPAKPSSNGNDDDTAETGPKKKKVKKDKEDPFVCGHVICKTCVDTIVLPQGRCCVCEASVTSAGRIPLGKEGTGFAAAGGAEVKKAVTSFLV